MVCNFGTLTPLTALTRGVHFGCDAEPHDALVDSIASTTLRFETNPVEVATIETLPSDPRIPSSALHEDGTIVETLEKYEL